MSQFPGQQIQTQRKFYMDDKVFNVLFLCTSNSARSLLAEAQLNELGKGRFKAYSAGSYPSGVVHPRAIGFLHDIGLSTDDLRSKSWDEFDTFGAPIMDYVITVCDDVAGDLCPVWPGQPISAHWSVEDPAAVTGSDDIKHHAFIRAATHLRKRIELFVSLPTSALDRMVIKSKLDDIGRSVDASL
jgi:arsenate reductase